MVTEPVKLLEKAARAGGDVLRKYFRNQNLTIEEKTSKHDIVTLADTEAQKAIISVLHREAPHYGLATFGIIGEEGVDISGEYRFVIDPLDGTSNYASNLTYFCVSIALMKGDKPVAAAIYDVMQDAMYTAEEGKGAYKNGHPISFRTNVPLDKSAVVVNISSRLERRKMGLSFLEAFFPHVRTIRLFGAVALDLARMADGEGNIAINFSCKIWDIAAGILILNEAGGEVVDPKGAPLQLVPEDAMKRYSVIASDSTHIKRIISLLSELGISNLD